MAERTRDCFRYQATPPISQFFGRTQFPNSGQPQIGCQKGEQIADFSDMEHDLMFNETYTVGGCNKRPATDEIKEGVAGSVSGDVVPFDNVVEKNGDNQLQRTYTRNIDDLMCQAAKQFQSNLDGFKLPSAVSKACEAPKSE